MVARSPPKQLREMVDPSLLREAVKKVDKCMVRLQELQYTVAGCRKLISPTTPTKQQSLKITNGNPRRISPSAKLPPTTEEWRAMSLPAMLLGETIGEIVEATQFASNTLHHHHHHHHHPTTPQMVRTTLNQNHHQTMDLHARRKREKQLLLQATRSQSHISSSSSSSSSQRAKSRIDFFQKTEFEIERENCSRSMYIANRVSPRNRPWGRKAVLFPNPLFHSSSPIKTQIQTPAAMMRRSFSPSRLAKRLVSPLKIRNGAARADGDASSAAPRPMRRSFSPSMVATRLVSPLKGRKSVQKKGVENVMRGIKQRPPSSSDQF